MSNLNIVLDLNSESKNIVFEEDFNDMNFDVEICVGIRKEDAYDNLSFGYSIIEDGVLVETISRPDPGTMYIKSNQNFLDFYLINQTLQDDERVVNYTIDFWCSESGQRYEGSHSFSMLLPKFVDPAPYQTDPPPQSA